jgi:predicted PurR-regulated permease PerM
MRVLGLVLAAAGLWVARAFLLQIVFAAILTIAIWPLYRRLARRATRLERRIFLPLAVTLGIGFVLIIPLAIIGAEAVRDTGAAAQWLAQASRSGIPPPHWLEPLPIAGHWLAGWWNHNIADPRGASALLRRIDAATVINWLETIAETLLSWSMFMLVTLLALFIIVRDGDRAAELACRIAARFYGRFGEDFVSRLAEAIRGTLNGTVFIALGEGTLIGIGYAFFQLPHPLAFMVATIGFALIPFGAWVAFGVASLVLILEGRGLPGALLFGYSSIVMLVGDNLVQPALIGNSIRLPFLWTFLGIFGGMYSFGLVGLFVGPAIMAALFLVWSEWLGTELPRGSRARRQRR